MTLQASDLVCWHCGQSLKGIELPLRRLAQCPACRSELHVCLMCIHYDTRYTSQCRHDLADKVLDKDRANFCGYLRPRRNAYVEAKGDEASRARLDAMFGDEEAQESESTDEPTAAERSRRDLDQLFDPADDE